MVKSTIDLGEKENDIVKAYMLAYGIEDKRIAINDIIKKYGDLDKAIIEMLKIKKGVK